MVTTFGELKRAEDGRWHLSAQPHVIIRLKRLFPRAVGVTRGFIIADTPDVALDLEWVMARWPLEMTDADRTHLTGRAESQRQKAETIARVLEGNRLDGVWRTMARTPRWPHQQINADMITANRRILITDGLGGGKTHSGNTTLRNPDSLPALVVAPTHLTEQWQEQLRLDWPNLTTHIIKRGAPYDVDVDVLICTYSKLYGWADVLAGRIRSVIVDEAQELRNGIGTNKGWAVDAVAQEANYVVGLTATPIYNYGGEIHSLMEIIAPDALGERHEFLREWCGSSYGGKPKVADPRALGSYLRELGVMVGHNVPRGEDEVPLQIPHVVESDDKVYEAAAGDAAELARFILDGGGTGFERMQASQELDWRLRQATGLAKAPYVARFVEMLLGQVDRVVLFGWHRAVYDVWIEQLGPYEPRLFTGSESPAQKRATKEAFLHGDCRVMVMSLRSGVGLDGLQERCHTAVFGELDWSPGVHGQNIGRLDRPGQLERVLAYFLYSNEGSDPFIVNTLGVKQAQAVPIVDPDAPLLAPTDDVDRVRLLAQAALEGHRGA